MSTVSELNTFKGNTFFGKENKSFKILYFFLLTFSYFFGKTAICGTFLKNSKIRSGINSIFSKQIYLQKFFNKLKKYKILKITDELCMTETS